MLEKVNLRKEVLSRRRCQSEEEIKRKSLKIKERLFSLPLFEKSKVIMFYVSFGSEVRTEDAIKETINRSKRVVVPKTLLKEKRLLLSELRDYEKELERGTFNILEPKEECLREVSPQRLDLIIVPGVVFDEKGYRIGYGGGFYDRFLLEVDKIISIGLAFELQVVGEIPRQEHDLKVNLIITERRVIREGEDFSY